MCEAAHVGHSNCITCIGPLPVGVVEGAIHPVPWLGPPQKSHPTLEPRCTHTHTCYWTRIVIAAVLVESLLGGATSGFRLWCQHLPPRKNERKDQTKCLWVRCLWTCSFPTGGRTCRGFLCLAFVLLMPYHLVLLYLETKFWDRWLWPP